MATEDSVATEEQLEGPEADGLVEDVEQAFQDSGLLSDSEFKSERPEEGEPTDATSESGPEPVALSTLQMRHYEKIQALEAQCDELEMDFDIKQSNAKSAKKRWESKVDELRRCIRTGPDAQQRLPFDDGDGDNAPQAAAEEAVDDSWAETPITNALSLTGKQREKLEEAGVKTVGEFERLRAGTPDHPGGLRDLPRVGDATVGKWEEEILDWLAQNQPVPEAEEVAEDDDAEETDSDDAS